MHMKVRDIMTGEVACVGDGTPFKDVAETLVTHGVSAVPVVDADRHVIGVISEADLLRKEEFREQYYHEDYRPPLRARLRERVGRAGGKTAEKARGDTAAELMTTPAVTIRSYATVVAAARKMNEHGVKRLPVIDEVGRLEGIVSRHDILKVLARDDDDIAREVREDIIEGALWADPPDVQVSVADGVVTLSGQLARRSDARMLVRMTERVNGVIDLVDRLRWRQDDST